MAYDEEVRNNLTEKIFLEYVRPGVAEFLGTCLYLFLAVCIVGSGTEFTPLIIGLIITGTIIALLDISGGHVNPAITLAMYIVGEIKLSVAVVYVLSQLTGSTVGAALAKAVLHDKVWNSTNGGSLDLGENISVGVGILTEVLITANLVVVTYVSAVDKKTKSDLLAVSIGISVAAGIFAASPITGGSMNPARCFGPALVASHWEHHYIYWIGPTIGTILGGILYRLVLASEEKRILWKQNEGMVTKKPDDEQSGAI